MKKQRETFGNELVQLANSINRRIVHKRIIKLVSSEPSLIFTTMNHKLIREFTKRVYQRNSFSQTKRKRFQKYRERYQIYKLVMKYAILDLDPIEVQEFDVPSEDVWINYTQEWFGLTPQETFKRASYATDMKQAIYRLYEDFEWYKQFGPRLIEHFNNTTDPSNFDLASIAQYSTSPAAIEYLCKNIKNLPTIPSSVLFTFSKHILNVIKDNLNKVVISKWRYKTLQVVSLSKFVSYTNIGELKDIFQYNQKEVIKRIYPQVEKETLADAITYILPMYHYGFYFQDGEELLKYYPETIKKGYGCIYLGALSNNNLKMMEWCWDKIKTGETIVSNFILRLENMEKDPIIFRFEKIDVESVKLFITHFENVPAKDNLYKKLLDFILLTGQNNVDMFFLILNAYFKSTHKDEALLGIYNLLLKYQYFERNPACTFYLFFRATLIQGYSRFFRAQNILQNGEKVNAGEIFNMFSITMNLHSPILYRKYYHDPYRAITETLRSFELAEKHNKKLKFLTEVRMRYIQDIKRKILPFLAVCKNNHRKSILLGFFKKMFGKDFIYKLRVF